MAKDSSPQHVTLGQIAEKAGCSRSTVSRALRNHPQLPEATCKRIQALAMEMGWKPDPEASRLMRYLQSTKKQRIESALALINDFEQRERLQEDRYIRTLIDSARQRAEMLGFHLEEIWLRQKGMTPKRVNEILKTRGITGVLIPPEESALPSIELDWERLAVVATTTTALPVQMNRVLPDNFYNTNRLMTRILATGCKRPFLVTLHDLEARMEHATVQLYFSHLVQAGLEPQPVSYWDEPGEKNPGTRLLAALKKAKPDFLILPDLWIREILGPFADLPWACFSLKPEAVLGVNQRPEAIGAAAVDVLSAHVIRGDVGLPEIPRVLHIRGSVD